MSDLLFKHLVHQTLHIALRAHHTHHIGVGHDFFDQGFDKIGIWVNRQHQHQLIIARNRTEQMAY